MYRILIIVIVILTFICCNEKQTSINKKQIVATINDEKIYLEEIDKIIDQQLYGALYRI